MAKIQIYSKNGQTKVYAYGLKYKGDWLGERSVTVSVSSPEPLAFQVGDYLMYRGEKFVINYDPSVVKKARRNTYGEAFVYENVKFNYLGAELYDVRFRDYVLNDNGIHYSSLPTFSFYAETIDDLADRLQANTNRWCSLNDYASEDYWKFFTPSVQRCLTRGITQEEYEEVYGVTPDFYTEDEKFNINVTIDKKSVLESLEIIKSQFGLNFVILGRNVIIGRNGIPTNHLFKYGKDKGLYEIERTADSDQQIVTKLCAYGSDKNMPIRYYANLNQVCYAKNTSADTFFIYTNLPCKEGMFTNAIENDTSDADTTSDTQFYSVNLLVGEVEITDARVFMWNNGSSVYTYAAFVISQDLVDVHLNDTFDQKIYFTAGIDKDLWDKSFKESSTENIPNNMAINCLMLPGFPNTALSDLCRCRFEEYDGETPDHTVFEIRKDTSSPYNVFLKVWGKHIIHFSPERLEPYLLSDNYKEIGVRENDITFNESTDDNGLKEIYPSIEGLTTGDVYGTDSTERIDEIYDAEVITDNGVFGEGDYTPKNFKITLKPLGFDLHKAFTNSGSKMVIYLKDGYCGAREFNVKSVKANGNLWVCSCERFHDDLLDLYFPYSYNVSIGREATRDEAYQIREGDHFVLTDIDIEETSYIWAASVKLLRQSILWLIENDYVRYTYVPKIDEIFMQRQHLESLGIKDYGLGTYNVGRSLYQTIREGDVMLFEDADLNVDGSVYVDTLEITEDGNNGIPTYSVTLRNDKQVGSIQRIQNKIDSLTSVVNSGEGGLSVPQTREIITAYGADLFLSKVRQDVAQDVITFLKGLRLGDSHYIKSNGEALLDSIKSANFSSGEYGSGAGMYLDESEQSWLEIDNLLVRKRLKAVELEILRKQFTGGNLSLSCASGEIVKVERFGGVLYRCYFKATNGETTISNPWRVGDMAKCQTFNAISGTTYNAENRYWWRLVLQTGTKTIDGELHNFVVFQDSDGKGDDVGWFKDTSVENDIPAVGDVVVQEGNTIDNERQNLITLDVAGNNAPQICQYQGVGSDTTSAATQYNLSNHLRTTISPNGNHFYAKSFIIEVEEDGVVREYNLTDSRQLEAFRAELAVTTKAITQRVSALEYGNLLTGLADGAGWDYISFDKDTCGFYTDGSQLIESPIYQLDRSKIYCFSCYCDTTQKATIVLSGDTVDIYSFTDVDRTDVYQGKPRRFAVLTECDNVQLVFESEGMYYRPQIEEVASLDDSPTAFKEGQWKTEGMIKVSADNILLAVNDTGINIKDKIITLMAKNTFVDGTFTAKSLQTSPATNGQFTKIKEGIAEFYGAMGIANIRVGIDEYGQAVLKFYDNAGTFLYDLGPNGMTSISQVAENFSQQGEFVNYSSDGDTALGLTDWDSLVSDIKDMIASFVYQYTAQQTRTQSNIVYHAGDYCSDVATAEQANNRMFESRNVLITYVPVDDWSSSANAPLTGVYIKVTAVASGREGVSVEGPAGRERYYKITYGAFTELTIFRYKNGLLLEKASASDASEHIIKKELIIDGISNNN